jgi:hypothetical protein
MGTLKNRNPSEPRRQDLPITRSFSTFSGMITGEPQNKLPPQYATLNDNIIDMGQYSKVRPGSKLYTGEPFPEFLKYDIASIDVAAYPGGSDSDGYLGWELWGYIATVGDAPEDGTLVWFVGKDLPEPFKTDTPYWITRDMLNAPPGYPDAFLLKSESGDVDPIEILSLGTVGNYSLFNGGVMGFCDHSKAKKLIWHIGQKVYVSDKNITEFIEVNNLSSNVHYNDSKIIPFDDYAIMCSEVGGISRIVLDDSPYMYQINISPPNVVLTEVNETLTAPIKKYGYLYLFSYSRIKGNVGDDRVSDGAVLEFETGTNQKDGVEKDYAENYFETEIGIDVSENHIVSGFGTYPIVPDTSINTISVYRTKNIGLNSGGDVNRRDQMVWVADIPATIDSVYSFAPLNEAASPKTYTATWVSGYKLKRSDVGTTIMFSDEESYASGQATISQYLTEDTCVIEYADEFSTIPANNYNLYIYTRCFNDTIPDEPTIDGRVSLADRIGWGTDLYIPRRLFRAMPNCNMAYAADGFLVVGLRDGSEYAYCSTGDKRYTIGQYKYPEQLRPVTGAIRQIEGMPYKAILFCKDKTAVLTLSSSQNIGRTEIGENIFQLPELSIVDTVRGIVLWKMLAYKNTNIIFAITNEGALRYFDGNAWSAQDYAFYNGMDAVSKEYLRRLDQSQTIHMIYSTAGGLKLWFKRNINGLLVDTCLRFATESGEGIGWSLISGDNWISPAERLGVFTVLDDSGIQRTIAVDNDTNIYEFDTFDRVTDVKPFALDRIGINGDMLEGSEIPWKKRWREEVISQDDQHDSLIDELSHVYTQPDSPENRGITGYTTTGQRDAQELTLRTYLDGEKTVYAAQAKNFPEGGEIVFTGRDVEANRIMKELEGTASEILITGMVNDFLGRINAPSVALRTMTEHNTQKELSTGLILHTACRCSDLINFVTGVNFNPATGNVRKAGVPNGPDGRVDSALWNDYEATSDNQAADEYTIIFWARGTDAFPNVPTDNPIPDLSSFTSYGDLIGTWWRMFYKKGTDLPANIRIAGACIKFDVRIYNKEISDEDIAALYEDVVTYGGKMFLPGFKL